MSSMEESSSGFTLIEILLSVALMGIIAGIGIPVYQVFQNQNDLDIATTVLVQSVRRAETLARAMDRDSNWGVYVSTGAITIFKGESYSGRDLSMDEVYAISESISISGATEYVFLKFTGYPTEIGNTTLISVNNDERTVAISIKGVADY